MVSLTDIGTVGTQIAAAGDPVEALRMKRGIPNPLALLRLARQIRDWSPDVVQTWLYHADLLGLLAARLARVGNVAWNVRCSYMGEDYYRGMSGLVLRALVRLSAKPLAVVVNSQAGQELHEALGYRPKRWVVIPNGFDLVQFRSDTSDRALVRTSLGLSDEHVLIGMVGRYDPVKGHDTFVAAATKAAKSQPGLKFALIGPGCDWDNAGLKALITPDLAERFLLLGERRDMPSLTRALDIATCASIGEGFPNVIGEAMACEVPCVVTDVGDCAAIVGSSGRVVAPENPRELADAWLSLVDLGTQGRRSLGSMARSRIERAHSIAVVIRRYETLYEELAGATVQNC